jgi:hypothetical protein
MEDVQQSIRQLSFDKSPAEEIFSASVEAWKKNLDAFAGTQKPQAEQYDGKSDGCPAPLAKTAPQMALPWENMFGCMVQGQMELCRFFERRWEQYLYLPGEISRCRSPVELAQLQLAFLTRMAADYGLEGRHFARAFQDLVPEALTFNSTPFLVKELPHS